MKRTAVGALCALVVLCTSAFGVEMKYHVWEWFRQSYYDSVWDGGDQYDLELTRESGSHAVAIGISAAGEWTSVAYQLELPSDPLHLGLAVIAQEWDGEGIKSPYGLEADYGPFNACVAANESRKLWMWTDRDGGGVDKSKCVAAWDQLRDNDPDASVVMNKTNYECACHQFTGFVFPGNNTKMVGVPPV